jgi:hypothetical protein
VPAGWREVNRSGVCAPPNFAKGNNS